MRNHADHKPKLAEACGLDQLFRLMTGRWTLHILWVLSQDGPTRFGQLLRRLPGKVSAKVLTERLRSMEKAGVISREEILNSVPEVIYALTPRGSELDEILRSLNAVAQRWAASSDSKFPDVTKSSESGQDD